MPSKSTYHAEKHHETFEGDRTECLARRKKAFKDLKATADKVLKDWDGQPIVIITARDTGDGKTQVMGFDGGVGNTIEQVAIVDAIQKVSHDLQHQIAENMPDPAEMLAELLKGASKKQ